MNNQEVVGSIPSRAIPNLSKTGTFCYFACHLMLGLSFYSGPSCSKLTMSLVNDSLKFTSSDTQIC